jgi:hypothetical protein
MQVAHDTAAQRHWYQDCCSTGPEVQRRRFLDRPETTSITNPHEGVAMRSDDTQRIRPDPARTTSAGDAKQAENTVHEQSRMDGLNHPYGRPKPKRPFRHSPTAIVSVALGAAASLLALAVWGGLAYLNRGVYNPADVIVLLGFALAIPSCIACAVAALILAAIARKQRPSIRDQPEAIARAKRDRNMTTVAIALALLPLIAFGIIMLAPR